MPETFRYPNIKRFLVILILPIFLLNPALTSAVIYQPGETLDPACLPSDSDCGVDTTLFSNTLTISAITSPSTPTNQLYNVGGSLFWNGSQISGLSNIVSLNGLTGAAQTFTTGTSGTDFNITTSGTSHVFNIPSASGTNRGLLTSADWTTFNSKQPAGSYLTSITANSPFSGSGTALSPLSIDLSSYVTSSSAPAFSGLALSTTSGSPSNSIDQATITVGNIASTESNNFSTLNITNGGSGYLDIELIRGFINFQNINTLYDDFTQRTLETNKWLFAQVGGGGTCSNTIVAGGVNGLLRIVTASANGRGCLLSTQSNMSNGFYQRSYNPIFETKLKMSTTNPRIFAGFSSDNPTSSGDTSTNTHHAYILKRAADTTWQCSTSDAAGTETITDTGVSITADTLYRLRVEVRNGSTPQTICTVDNGTTVTRVVITATQPGATNSMDVFIQGSNSDTTAENIDIDYVRAWQDDPVGEIIEQQEEQITEEPKEDVVLDESLGLSYETLDNLVLSGALQIENEVDFGKDTVGEAVIKSGDNEVLITFETPYIYQPIITISKLSQGYLNDYFIDEISKNGFKIKLDPTLSKEIRFSWHAFGSLSGQRTFSDGLKESINTTYPHPIFVEENILNNPALDVAPEVEAVEPIEEPDILQLTTPEDSPVTETAQEEPVDQIKTEEIIEVIETSETEEIIEP